jgi:hypothetical protein
MAEPVDPVVTTAARELARVALLPFVYVDTPPGMTADRLARRIIQGVADDLDDLIENGILNRAPFALRTHQGDFPAAVTFPAPMERRVPLSDGEVQAVLAPLDQPSSPDPSPSSDFTGGGGDSGGGGASGTF